MTLMGVQSSVFNRQAPIDQVSVVFGVVSDVESQPCDKVGGEVECA